MKIKNLSMKFISKSGLSVTLINDLNLEIEEKSVISILSPFGSGKSTLLKIAAGLEEMTSGEIIPESHSKTVFIPSGKSSFPWFSVNENFTLVSQKQELKEEIIRLLELEGYENHNPNSDSKGFRFLISFGMALLSGADLILVDDPFNDVSDLMKERIIRILRKAREKKGISVLLATSNLSDSVLFSDKVIVMQSNPMKAAGEVPVNSDSKREIAYLRTPEAEGFKKKIVELFNSSNTDKAISISI